jgi:hypothetical protein
MKAAIIIILLASVLLAQADGFGGSSGGAFISSPANARGTYQAGIKTATVLIPIKGYGNVVNSNGSCSYDPTIPWIYTKVTTNVSYSYFFGSIYNGNDTPTVQALYIAYCAAHGGAGVHVDDGCPSGYSYTTPTNDGCGGPAQFCWNDYSSQTNFQSVTGTNLSGSSSAAAAFFQYYAKSGTAVGIATTNYGSIGSIPGEVDENDYSGIWDTNYYAADSTAGHGVLQSFYLTSVSVAGGTCTDSRSGQWQGICAIGPDGGNIFPCSAAYQNTVYGTKTMTYVKTIEYSVPVAAADFDTNATSLLDSAKIQYSFILYQPFDRTSFNIVLQWNAVVGNPSYYYTYDIYKSTNGSGPWSIIGFNYFNSYQTTYTNSVPINTTNYYRVVMSAAPGLGSTSAVVSASTTIGDYPIVARPPPFQAVAQASNSPISGLVANVQWPGLVYTNMANATNCHNGIVLLPVSDPPYSKFLLSTKVSFANYPVFLSSKELNNDSNFPSISTTGVGSGYSMGTYGWSRSVGFLFGNCTNHSPPTTNLLQKIYWQPIGSTVQDVTPTNPPLQFNHGIFGTWPVQTGPEMIFRESAQAGSGYYYYK